MNALVVACVVALPFVGITFAIYRVLKHRVDKNSFSPVLAALVLWLLVLCLPWLLTRFWVPITNYVFITFPALQTPSWDVGLAISIYLGMWLSYAFGGLFAGVISWRFLCGSPSDGSESAT